MAALLAACVGVPRGGPTRAEGASPANDRHASVRDAWSLSPRDLEAPVALQQRLVIERGGQSQAFDALLEADANGLQLVVQAMGQTAMTLRWDGRRLNEQRADWLPPQVDGARVLQDLQFALWPLEALQRAAPQGWHVVEQGDVREVFIGDRLVVGIHHRRGHDFVLERPGDGYRLRVSSVVPGVEAP
ncbi:MAG: DUF3261 domain-containing protein [Silanimonas sp.]